MWIVRELSRLLVRIAVAVAIASLIAGVKALVAGGPMLRTWKVTLLALGCLMLLLAVGGSGPANRRVNQRLDVFSIFPLRIPRPDVRTDGPTLTASAVFVGSGLALLVLGVVV